MYQDRTLVTGGGTGEGSHEMFLEIKVYNTVCCCVVQSGLSVFLHEVWVTPLELTQTSTCVL